MHRSELLRGKVVSVSGSTSSETYGNTVGPEERRGKDEVIMNTEWPVMKSRSLTPSVTDKVDSKKTLYASNVKIHENMGLE
jgi:hypothetical protein